MEENTAKSNNSACIDAILITANHRVTGDQARLGEFGIGGDGE